MLFICFLNWTDQGAKGVKGVAARHESLKAEIAGLGGRLIGGYVTRGQYDVVLVLEMPDGDAMTKLSVAMTSRGSCAHHDGTGILTGRVRKARGRGTLSISSCQIISADISRMNPWKS